MLVTENNSDFFSPLSGKNAKIIESSLISLYQKTYGDDFTSEENLLEKERVKMRRKILDKKNTLYFDMLYPYQSPSVSNKPYQVTLGIGGNVGDVSRRFHHLFFYLKRSPFIDIVETSPMLKNPPFGYLEQEDFYNAIVIVKTCLRPKALLRYILAIEKRFGRQRLFQDGPRTLDIDIIFYGQEVIHTKELTVPHPSWHERASVLIPLSYLRH